MWRVCITRMETKLTTVQSLIQFKNQQVIINFYEDDELVKREGFFFDSIHIVDSQLQFTKSESLIFSLPLEIGINFSQQYGFKNYYSIIKGADRVELYFP